MYVYVAPSTLNTQHVYQYKPITWYIHVGVTHSHYTPNRNTSTCWRFCWVCNVSVSLPCVPSDRFALLYLHVEWVSRSHPYLVTPSLYSIYLYLYMLCIHCVPPPILTFYAIPIFPLSIGFLIYTLREPSPQS